MNKAMRSEVMRCGARLAVDAEEALTGGHAPGAEGTRAAKAPP